MKINSPKKDSPSCPVQASGLSSTPYCRYICAACCMNISFKRITSSGLFIPEIDGLRFIAIAIVMLQHVVGFLSVKDPLLRDNLSCAGFFYYYAPLGVPLFFVISGFVLALPFARHFLSGGAKPKLKSYYLRRISRLEPPYLLAMTILLVGVVFVARSVPAAEALKSYAASIFYLHNIIYPDRLPTINPAAWSLEVEIQFYLLAPFLSYLFAIKSSHWRRVTLVILILLFVYLNIAVWKPGFISLYNWLPYFLTGFLLADLYITRKKNTERTRLNFLLALAAAAATGFSAALPPTFYREIAVLFCLFTFFYYVLFYKAWRFLSFPFFTAIGGMCYSIYLFHYAIISAVGNPLIALKWRLPEGVALTFYMMILLAAILFFSGIYYLLVERPCMKKDWYKAKNKQFINQTHSHPEVL